MELTYVGIWLGDYVKTVGLLAQHNSELRVRVSAGRLVVRCPTTQYYKCIRFAGDIEIPVILCEIDLESNEFELDSTVSETPSGES